MNEILLELARQTRLVPEDVENGDTPLNSVLESYAIAIIKECARVADINQHQYYRVSSYILKHFQIE